MTEQGSKLKDRLKLFAVAGLIAVVGVSGICAMVMLFADPQHSAPQNTPEQRLSGVILYKNRAGFGVCARQPLHHCVARWGFDNGGDRGTLRLQPVEIGSVATCDNITANAVAACSDAGVSPLAGTPTQPWLECAAQHGFIYRINPEILDPRDEHLHLRPGVLRVDCDEGWRDGVFDDLL